MISEPAGGRLPLYLQPVPEPKAGKNRAHVDLEASSLPAEIDRLCALGATVASRRTVAGQRPRLSWRTRKATSSASLRRPSLSTRRLGTGDHLDCRSSASTREFQELAPSRCERGQCRLFCDGGVSCRRSGSCFAPSSNTGGVLVGAHDPCRARRRDVLGAVAAGGRRTASAFPRFLDRYGYDVQVYQLPRLCPPRRLIPGVSATYYEIAYDNGDMVTGGRIGPRTTPTSPGCRASRHRR